MGTASRISTRYRSANVRFTCRFEIGLLGGAVQKNGDLMTDDTDKNHDNHNGDQNPISNSYERSTKVRTKKKKAKTLRNPLWENERRIRLRVGLWSMSHELSPTWVEKHCLPDGTIAQKYRVAVGGHHHKNEGKG